VSISSKIQSLITAANSVTGESRTDLTSAVQDLKDGYGQGGGGTDGQFFPMNMTQYMIPTMTLTYNGEEI
jgi:hypothetical protein